MIFRFRNFPVYKEAMKFKRELKKFVNHKFPESERFGLTNQLFRALNSIILNIAEGSGKYSDMEFSKFLNTSLASLDEVVACLDVALDDGYITNEDHRYWLKRAEDINKQLSAFTSKVRKDAHKK